MENTDLIIYVRVYRMCKCLSCHKYLGQEATAQIIFLIQNICPHFANDDVLITLVWS